MRTGNHVNTHRYRDVIGILMTGILIYAQPVYASGVTDATKEMVSTAYTGIAGIFSIVAALVILINLLLIMTATDERSISTGFGRIKMALICLVIAILLPTIINSAIGITKEHVTVTGISGLNLD